MLRFHLLCTCVLALSLLSCNSGYEGKTSVEIPDGAMGFNAEIEMSPPRTAEPPPPPPPADGSDMPSATEQRIIYTADARARVIDLDSAMVRLKRQVTGSGGFVSSERRTNSTYERTAELTLRLPADGLSGTLFFLPSIAEEIDYQNLESENVTTEWLDLESRLKTKRDVRDRYIDILRNRAQKVEDILNAEDKIRVITEEIEAKEGRLRYLRDQVSRSTLTITLYETIERRDPGPLATRGFGKRFLDSLAFGWEMVQELLLGFVAVWPIVILVGAGAWGVRRWRKRG